MTRDHSVIEELMAVEALGGLDGEDRDLLDRERAAHGKACPECLALEAGFAETAGRFAFALTPEPVDAAIADRILAPPAGAVGHADTVVHIPEFADPGTGSRRPRAWQVLVAAAAVVAIVVVAIAALAPSTTSVQASTSQRVVTFTGATEGTLAMAYTPGEAGAVFWGSGFDDMGSDRVLEVWMIEDGEAVSGGCVAPTDGVVAFRVDAEIGTTETMAVTDEPSDCPSAPTTEPVLTADLTTVV